jgi:SAM-dependent methyltransferase/uncharacterized protein YbaR (Trm112 family)
MQSQVRISQRAQELLRCPICRTRLNRSAEEYLCSNLNCAVHFPIVSGVPVLINEGRSVFSISDYLPRNGNGSHSEDYVRGGDEEDGGLKEVLREMVPSISANISADTNCGRVVEILLKRSRNPLVLVIGGSVLGPGVDCFADNPSIDLVESDVSFGPRTNLVCDAHDIPFEDGSFDGVIIQAVLEHVIDPYRCCEEIHRILMPEGVVYAETPFMQQVHGGRYDFTRFTHLGHRRLFRWFEEIDSGVVCGPGMALAWSYQYFLQSFAVSRGLRAILRVFANLTSFHLKYFDPFLVRKPGALDSASGYYFIGSKAEQPLPDRELMTLYQGLQ